MMRTTTHCSLASSCLRQPFLPVMNIFWKTTTSSEENHLFFAKNSAHRSFSTSSLLIQQQQQGNVNSNDGRQQQFSSSSQQQQHHHTYSDESSSSSQQYIDPEVIRSIHQRIHEYSQRVQQARSEDPTASFKSVLSPQEQKDLASCYNNLGFYCLQKLNKTKEALFYFLQSLQLNYNNDPIIVYNAASLFEREGNKPDSAAELYLRAIRIDPYFVDAKIHLARIWAANAEESSRFQGAEYLLKDLMNTHNHFGAVLELAMLYSRKGEHFEQYREQALFMLDMLLKKFEDGEDQEVDFKKTQILAPASYKNELISHLDSYMAGYRNSDMEKNKTLLLEDPSSGRVVNLPLEGDDENTDESFPSFEVSDGSYRFHAQDNEVVSALDAINVKAYLLKKFQRQFEAKQLFDSIIQIIETKDFSTTFAKLFSNLSPKAMAELYMNCAILSNGMGEVDQSIALLEKAFDITKGKDANVMACLALYTQEKNPQVSDLLFKRVISLEPEEFQHYIAYSSFLHHQSRTNDAIRLLERTMKKYPHMQDTLQRQLDMIRGKGSSDMFDLFGGGFPMNQ
nr:unnamed protein product [Naegleria fowleri]